SAQELSQEVKAFLSGLDPVQGTPLSPPAHARCALRLLRCLPPARGAALQHLRGLFDDQVCSHLLQREAGAPAPSPKGCPGAEVLQEARGALAELVAANPRAWAPGVAAWASELMGQLSSKYSSRPGVPPAASLNELLQLWMSCPATRALLDIYSQCLAAMAGSCPDACVDALLDTSVQHSPHFDWVVAHVGSSFPGTIISRVLSCGLKDFCAHGGGGGGEAAAPGAAGDKRVPKIASVVGILGHLASRHAGSIKQELLRMFHESLGSPREHHKATVPFLLQLALMSPALLAAVSPELVDSLKPPVLNQLHQHFSGLPREELEGVVGVVVHLLCHTSAGALRTLRFLLATAALLLHPGAEVAEAACRLLAACPLPRALPPAHLLPCVRAAVHSFFAGLWAGEAAALAPGVKLLARLSSVSPAAAKAVLAQLVEGALGGRNAELFGGTAEPPGQEAAPPVPPAVSLLDTNRRFTAGLNTSGGVWSVFHAGVIGGGPKPAPGRGRRGPEELSRNTQTFLSLVLRCCRGSSPAVSAEAAKAVAAALVEAVCPEAAGAELSWPPEELARATVERDLRILRRFRQHPLLFPLLRLVAGGHPALCYCSVLLRGLLASLVAHWDACRAASTVASPWHLQASCALVALLAEGSLLPPVLGNMHELFPELAPFEVHLLLLSVWGYLRENSPLPQKFTFQPELGVFRRDFGRDGDVGKHLAVLHSVLHRNIHRLGLLAGRF
ncbi:INT5 protein, partial [Leiothrix lutea]|nr:INT5 protein [Leiothrix lutea]